MGKAVKAFVSVTTTAGERCEQEVWCGCDIGGLNASFFSHSFLISLNIQHLPFVWKFL